MPNVVLAEQVDASAPGPNSTKKAKETFEGFLAKYKVNIGTIDELIPMEVLMPDAPNGLKLTEFQMVRDTLLYSDMIVALLDMVSPKSIRTMIDLGSGSVLPTIRALVRIPKHNDLHVIGVDILPEAALIGKNNAGLFGLDGRFTFITKDMLQFLRTWKFEGGEAVVANPPYQPVPEDVKDDFFRPVDGGSDGTKYLEGILTHSIPAQTIIGIRWGSLSNPVKMISLIEQSFRVLYVDAFRTTLGKYVSSPQLRPYIEEQSKKGLSVFTDDGFGGLGFTFVNCILEKLKGGEQ